MNHTELHRHLDASFRPATLLELVQRYKIDAPFRTVAEVEKKFWITEQMGSLKEVLDCFVLFQKTFRDEAVFERIAREAVEDAHAENIGAIEFRYSPSFVSEFCGVDWAKALLAIQKGLRAGSEKTGIKVGLICIVSRNYGVKSAHETIDFALAHREHFVGVDLAGDEVPNPPRLFKDAFRKAVDAGLGVTIHAGESAGPEYVWEAIDLLGATRIGHGIHSTRDPELMRRLERDKILLETCPTSNYVTRSIEKWQDHPLPTLLNAGIPVSVSTDDPGIFGNTIASEYERCRNLLGLSSNDLKKIDAYAAEHSFFMKENGRQK